MNNDIFCFFLLDDAAGFSQALAAWSQVALAIGSLILAFKVAYQTTRIKELSDVVKELKNQTISMNNSYLLEKSVTIKERMPFFIAYSYDDKEDNRIFMKLVNEGLTATDITCIEKSKSEMDVAIPYSAGGVGYRQVLQIELYFSDNIKDGFHFTFSFRSPHGFVSKQKFIKNVGENFRIDPPQDIQFN